MQPVLWSGIALRKSYIKNVIGAIKCCAHLDFARYGGLGSVRRPKCPIREIPRMVLASATFVPQYATRDFQVSFKNIQKLQSAIAGDPIFDQNLDTKTRLEISQCV